MNIYTIINCQRIVFSILFILTGIYLVIFLIKEIYYLFAPPKQVQEISRSIVEIKSDKKEPIINYFPQKQKSKSTVYKNKEKKSRKRRKKS